MSTPRRFDACLASAVVLVLLGLLGNPVAAQPTDGDKLPTPSGPAADGDETDAADAAPAGEAASAEALLAEAAEIADQVAEIRGLMLKREIDKGVRNRDELRKLLITKLAEQVTDAEITHEAMVFKKLGLMPQDLDYKEMLLDVLTEQIAGFYDQETKELYIMQGIPLSLQRPAMAHEIFHAIQDQHFDIKRMVEPISSRENGDFSLARTALIEGDASLVMIDFALYESGVLPQDNVRSIVDIPMMVNMLRQLSITELGALEQMVPQETVAEAAPGFDPSNLSDTSLAKAPRIVRHLLIFPYFGGMKFVIDARAGHSWSRINAIYDNPPVSTEQILHPERYFAGDDPVHLSFDPGPVLDDAQPVYDSVFGELQMRLFLEEHLVDPGSEEAPPVDIDEAVMGWDGDRILAYTTDDGDDVALTHLSAWDTFADAREYFDAMGEVIGRRFPEATVTRSQGRHGESICLTTMRGGERERVYLERWGDLVLYISGSPSALDARNRETDPTTFVLREQIWQTVERRPFADVLAERVAAFEASQAEAASDSEAEQPAK